jgi:glutamine synthetase
MNAKTDNLEKELKNAHKAHESESDPYKIAVLYRDGVFKAMADLREDADILETIVDREIWPFPTYGDILYNI